MEATANFVFTRVSVQVAILAFVMLSDLLVEVCVLDRLSVMLHTSASYEEGQPASVPCVQFAGVLRWASYII